MPSYAFGRPLAAIAPPDHNSKTKSPKSVSFFNKKTSRFELPEELQWCGVEFHPLVQLVL